MHLRFIKALLWLVCGSHLALGFAGVFSPTLAVDAAKVFYGAQVEPTPVNLHLLRIIGAYMITIGIMGWIAAREPQRHRPVIVAIAVLLLIRVVQRLTHAGDIQLTFGVSDLRIWLQSAYFAALAGALLFLMPKRGEIS
jgi:hypothetical protein